MKPCEVKDCPREYRSSGYCSPHAHRFRRYGDPLASAPRKSSAERFWEKVDADGDCWIWTSSLNPAGYGTFSDKAKQSAPNKAHRWAWEELIGPIPPGLQLDHLCRVRRCVNPDHLEPVTNIENQRRGLRGKLYQEIRQCHRGHPYDETNTYMHRGAKHCRKCVNQRGREYYQRQKVST